MSAVGWVGLGKLGLPCALALASAGHTVTGCDRTDYAAKVLAGLAEPPAEDGIKGYLVAAGHRLKAGSVEDVVRQSDGLVFVAVQTSHNSDYGGDKPMPADPADFDYSHLVQAVREIAAAALAARKVTTIVVISTVLPGTMRKKILPLCRQGFVRLIYNPYFTATGTAISDMLNPEFVLIGAAPGTETRALTDLVASLHSQPVHVVSIESAELTKVAYNTFISMKIVFANMVGQVCEATGADCDEVTDGLQLANRRILSRSYMSAGMGDGGPCHPRDNMAMSWLLRSLGLPAEADLPGFVSRAREAQSMWLAQLVAHHSRVNNDLPVVLLGRSFKAGSRLTDGSPAILLGHHLRELRLHYAWWDPYLSDNSPSGVLADRAVFVIATDHPEFADIKVAEGSVVIDPIGHYNPRDLNGITIVRPGRQW